MENHKFKEIAAIIKASEPKTALVIVVNADDDIQTHMAGDQLTMVNTLLHLMEINNRFAADILSAAHHFAARTSKIQLPGPPNPFLKRL